MNKFGYEQGEDETSIVNQFSQNLIENKLIGNKCITCNTIYFPPRVGCEKFHNNFTDYEIQNIGILKAFTVIHYAPENMAHKAPYIIVIGEMEENVRVLAHLVGILEKPKIGMKIKLKVQILNKEHVTYKFIPL